MTVVLIAAGAIVAAILAPGRAPCPEIKRYLKIRTM